MPCEQWKNPGCLKVYRGLIILPSDVGIVIFAWNKDPYWTTGIMGAPSCVVVFQKMCHEIWGDGFWTRHFLRRYKHTHTISCFGRKNMLMILLDNIWHQLIQVQVSKYGEYPKWIAVSQLIQVKKRSVLFHLFEDLSQKIIHVMLVFAFFLPNLYLFISSVHLFNPKPSFRNIWLTNLPETNINRLTPQKMGRKRSVDPQLPRFWIFRDVCFLLGKPFQGGFSNRFPSMDSRWTHEVVIHLPVSKSNLPMSTRCQQKSTRGPLDVETSPTKIPPKRQPQLGDPFSRWILLTLLSWWFFSFSNRWDVIVP